jgi:hypothetical protein
MSRKEAVVRYWGRKPRNLAEMYIRRYTSPSQIVLDNFGGSGIFVKTAVELRRRAIYVDLNPFAYLIAKTAIVPCDPIEFVDASRIILSDSKIRFKGKTIFECERSKLFSIRCKCGKVAEVSSIAYGRIYNKLHKGCVKLKGRKRSIYMSIATRKNVTHEDLILLHPELSTQALSNIVKWLVKNNFVKEDEFPLEAKFVSRCVCGRKHLALHGKIDWLVDGNIMPLYWYPDDRLEYDDGTPFLKRRDATSISQLFTRRNLIALASLWETIRRMRAKSNVKDYLRVTFMATLARSSKMCRTKGGTWPINSYWIPRTYIVRNPYIVFKNAVGQVSKLLKSRLEVRSGSIKDVLAGRADVTFLLSDSTRLRLPRNSIDYVIIDPPHTDEAQFFELSFFYTSWLKLKPNFSRELIINHRQGKELDMYLKMICGVSKRIYDSLKKNRYYTIILHGDDRKVLDSCRKAISHVGFELVEKVVIDGYTIYTFKK